MLISALAQAWFVKKRQAWEVFIYHKSGCEVGHDDQLKLFSDW